MMESKNDLNGSPASAPFRNIIVVGAGPCGLISALLLARSLPRDVPITILESWSHVDPRLRATQYGSPASRIFREAGILDDVRKDMITNFSSICWRNVKRNNERIVGIDLGLTDNDDDRMTVMPLNLLLEIILKHIATHPNITLLFNHKVTSLTQTPDSAILVVEVSRPNDIVHTQTFSADYILACDGSSSTLRSLIFGPHHWPGMTWPETLAVQNVHYAGFAAHGWTGAHYLISPEHPGLVAERGKGGLWRITLIETHPDAHTLQHDPEAWAARRAEHFRAIFPGHPEPGDYTVEETDWYKAHNRSVARMRAGRVLFAGDAAHTCNPAGGYGAMAGILDASGLADCLVGLYRGWCGEEILDVYSRVRMDKFREYVDRRSALNYRRLTEADADRVLEEEGRGGDRLLRLLKGLEDRPEEARTFLLKHSKIEYDFKQHWDRTRPQASSAVSTTNGTFATHPC